MANKKQPQNHIFSNKKPHKNIFFKSEYTIFRGFIMKKDTIVLTGGGTAGHVTPNINLIPPLKNHFKNIYYIGSSSIEKELIKNAKLVPFYEISGTKLIRGKFFANFLIPFKLIKAIIQAKRILKKLKPNIVFSKGGYVSVPVVIASWLLKIPIVCHESDLSMGLANKICAKHAKAVCTTFKKTAENLKNGIYTGAPLSKKLTMLNKTLAKQQLNIPITRKILLITGGSLGSQAINQACFNISDYLNKNYEVYHVVGKGNLNKNINLVHYHQIEFADNMPLLICASDYCISRAGSNTIFELALSQKPMLLIPLPKGASRGDQVENAKYFAEKKYALMLEQDELNSQNLIKSIEKLQKNAQILTKSLKDAGFKDGTESVINVILKHAK